MTVEPIIRAISPAITIFSVPFYRFNTLPVGGRSTAIKLQNGGIWILVSSPLTESTKAAITSMNGPVEWLVTPDFVHAGYISEFHKEYPEAKCVAMEGMDEKKKDVKWFGLFGKFSSDFKFGWEDEFETRYFPTHPNKEIAFLHKPSKTLIEADLMFNLPGHEQFKNASQGIFKGLASHMSPTSSFHKRVVNGFAKANPKQFSEDAKAVAAWDFDRIIPCHGDVIETGGKEAWNAAFADQLN